MSFVLKPWQLWGAALGAWINQQQREVIEKRPDLARPEWFDEMRHRVYCPSLRTTNVASP
jgi:hypothetical protein